MTEDQAKKLFETQWWEGKTHRDLAGFQLFEPRLCMPFSVFHESVEKSLGRSVFTHEFGLNRDGLKKEFLGVKEPPTFQQILELIPKEKRIVVFGGERK